MTFTNAISTNRTPIIQNFWLKSFIAIFFSIWVSSLLGTTDLPNWLLENALVFGFVAVLFFTYKKHQFSDLSYLLICVYLCLHVYGAKHTYAENPLGYWLQEVFQTSRNHYDRIVHFSFGFLLAYPMREAFLKWAKFPNWVAWLLPIEIVLSVSGLYELIEWAVAEILFPEQGVSYLGTQGDMWDAQKDIFLAFSGAILATTIVSALKTVLKIQEKPAA
jgi:putative membrane protein